MTVRMLHTADLAPAELAAIRGLLDEAFDGDVSEHDWEHALGGMHALVWEGSKLVGHGSVVQRRLLHGGRALRTGYVEAMAVRPGRQGQGHGRAVLAALERVIRGGFELGALASSDAGLAFYAACGWQRWCGRTFALTPTGVVRTEEEDDAVFVLPVTAPVDLAGDLTCDWRDGDLW